MKTLLLSMILFAFGFTNDGGLEKAKTFPKYNKALYFVVGTCSCTGAFCSCDQSCDGSNCTCTCGAFSCTCSECKQLPKNEAYNLHKDAHDLTPVSISESQYKNIEKLATLLKSNNDESSLKAHNLLVDMIKMLETQDYASYHKTADVFTNQLKSLPLLSKNSVNALFLELGTDLRI
jgi:hypothetical protein